MQLSRCFENPISRSFKFGGLLQDQSARGEIPKSGTYTVSRLIPCWNMPHPQRRNIQSQNKSLGIFHELMTDSTVPQEFTISKKDPRK